MILRQVIYYSGDGIEACEIKRGESVVVEQLLRGDEFTVECLRQFWLIGKTNDGARTPSPTSPVRTSATFEVQ